MDSAAGRILIVDDDDALLELMRTYLARVGYQVDARGSAEEAWMLLQADPSLYSLALLDMSMPGMGGQRLAQRILELHPLIRVVVVSGYPAEFSGVEMLGGQRVSFLRKPFAPKELLDAVCASRGIGRPPTSV